MRFEVTVRLRGTNHHLGSSASSSPPPVPSSLGERSCRARFTLLGHHAHWSQTNRSHFPGSFPHCGSHSFTRHAIVAVAAAEKWTKKVTVLPECHLVMGFFLPTAIRFLGVFPPFFFLNFCKIRALKVPHSAKNANVF